MRKPSLHKNCTFIGYLFYQNNAVVQLVNALHDDQFNQEPTAQKQSTTSAMKDLSAAEKAKLNKYAKALIMSDNRKASAVTDYVKDLKR